MCRIKPLLCRTELLCKAFTLNNFKYFVGLKPTMIHEFRRVTIVRVRRPTKKDLNLDLQWFSSSLGLFGNRDKENSCFRVFVELIKAARKGQTLSSDEIANRSHLSRATVIHHLNKLIESGLVIADNNGYILRVENLEELVEEVKRDLNRVFEDLRIMAEDLDEELGLIKRKGKSNVISD